MLYSTRDVVQGGTCVECMRTARSAKTTKCDGEAGQEQLLEQLGSEWWGCYGAAKALLWLRDNGGGSSNTVTNGKANSPLDRTTFMLLRLSSQRVTCDCDNCNQTVTVCMRSSKSAIMAAHRLAGRPAPCINQPAALPPCFVAQPPPPLLASHFLIQPFASLKLVVIFKCETRACK